MDEATTAASVAQILLCVRCQAWLALAHGDFHGLYQDPPGTVWSPEISAFAACGPEGGVWSRGE